MLPQSVANNCPLSDRGHMQVIEESQVKEIRDVRFMYDRLVHSDVALFILFREVQDLKSAIDNQSRNYRELQVHRSPTTDAPIYFFLFRRQARKCSLITGTSSPCRQGGPVLCKYWLSICVQWRLVLTAAYVYCNGSSGRK